MVGEVAPDKKDLEKNEDNIYALPGYAPGQEDGTVNVRTGLYD